ncbi:PRC-barrel domain-containing protein [Gilvimarinus sp. F26214L]|uniref:PRC-barrel domain-containing protein n=1 Tax=Gilvimarinus sp. DZF01 TaxID=3461371 RepID=UPI004045D861
MNDRMNPRPFHAGLALVVATGALLPALAGAQQDRQPARQDDGTEVRVEQAQPRVQVEEGETRVRAEQQETDVQVQSGEPEVSVEQPEPEVSVEQPEPRVTIEEAEPRVVVETAEPEVEVIEAEPEVMVNRQEPQIRVVTQDASGEQKNVQELQAANQGNQTQGQQAQPQSSGQTSQAASSSSDQQRSAPQTSRQVADLPLDELGNKSVVNAQGENLGSVEDIVVSESGQAGFVVSVGGVLGLGAEQAFIPVDETALQDDNIVWETPMNLQEISQNARYNADAYTSVADAQGTLAEARNEATQRARR